MANETTRKENRLLSESILSDLHFGRVISRQRPFCPNLQKRGHEPSIGFGAKHEIGECRYGGTNPSE